MPSEKFGVLTRAEVEELAALVAGLTEWTARLQGLCEQLNDKLTIAPSGPPPRPGRPLSFYEAEDPRQADLWEGFPLDDQ